MSGMADSACRITPTLQNGGEEADGGESPAAPLEALNLTQRQLDILALLGAGKGNKQIAHELGIGVGTVKQHMVALFKKLNVKNRTMAVSRGLALSGGDTSAPALAEPGESVLELRSATVLSIAVALPADAEDGRQAWGALQSAVANATMGMDCTIVGRPAAGLDVIFGLSRVREEDSRQALATARAIAATLPPTGDGEAPPLRAGLASGVLLASMEPRGGWTGEMVAGRVIGRARDLRDGAQAGTLHMAPESLAMMEFAGRGGDEVEPVDGLAVPLTPLAPVADGTRMRAPATAVGRAAERLLIESRLNDLRKGKGSVLWVEGEAGMGKTTLCRTLAARCAELGLGSIFIRCGREPLRNVLAALPPGAVPSAAIIDDLHAADSGDVEALEELATRAGTSGILVLGSGRSVRPASLKDIPGAAQVRLSRMPPADIETVIEARGGGGLSPAARARIVNLANGVPLFAVELVKAALASGRRGAERLPLTLVTVVQSRLDTIEADRRLLHRVASVAPVDAGAIEPIRGLPAGARTRAEIERAIAAGILVRRGETVDFAHPLVRAVVQGVGTTQGFPTAAMDDIFAPGTPEMTAGKAPPGRAAKRK